jgi:acetyl esterase/lipase
MIILASILSGLPFLMSILLIIKQPRFPRGFWLLLPKLPAGALSPYWAIMGIVGAVIGWRYEAYWAIPMGILGAGIMIWYVWRCTQDHKGFDKAFGADWSEKINPEQAKHMAKKRWTWFLKMKTSPQPVWERDIPFWTIPDTQRELLCDIWRPADDNVSGLALIYIHGGAWFMWDKDYYTRSFFRHLVAQGHTVMDVSYRLCPETDMYGMIGDVKHAIAWMKANASRYGVNPEKIVLGGASAGGHLAQLIGYTPGHPELTPEDLKAADQSVCGVFSYYGFTDVLALYQYMNLGPLEDQPPVPVGTNLGPNKGMRYMSRFDILFGGWPEDTPYIYQLASPVTHVHPGCPPTLLIQGEQDVFCPVDATRAHHTKLVEAGVPAINIVFPWTNHAFDLLFPQISPAAQSALYDVDRFLALLLNKDWGPYHYL